MLVPFLTIFPKTAGGFFGWCGGESDRSEQSRICGYGFMGLDYMGRECKKRIACGVLVLRLILPSPSLCSMLVAYCYAIMETKVKLQAGAKGEE